MKNWFLYRVYKLNRRLFVFFILFLSGTLFTNLLGWQATPFFVWGMFSEKEARHTQYPVLRITINDSSVVNYIRYTDLNRFYLTSPMQLYVSIKKNGEDPTKIFLKRKLGQHYSAIQHIANKVLNNSKEYDLFLPWYKRYLEQTIRAKIYNYRIDLLHVKYTGENKIDVSTSELIAAWQE